MPFKLSIARFWSNSYTIYCHISGEGNECGNRVRQIWRRGPRQYWLRGWRMSVRHSPGRERSHVFPLLLHPRETKQHFGVRYENKNVPAFSADCCIDAVLPKGMCCVMGAIHVWHVNYVREQRSQTGHSCPPIRRQFHMYKSTDRTFLRKGK